MAEAAATYSIRPCAPDDCDAVLALIAACETEEMGSPDSAMLDGVSATWQRSDFRWDTSTWLATAADDGQRILGYAHLQPVERADLQAFASVHPEARGRGVGAALLAHIEQRATEQLGRFAPDERVVLQQWVAATNAHTDRLLEHAGYQVVRHIWGMITSHWMRSRWR